MKHRVRDIVWTAVRDVNESLERKVDLDKGEDAPLFGADAPLDSLSLVCVITGVESMLENKLHAMIVLANEEAFSRSPSPFTTMRSLIDYTCELLEASSAF